MKKVGKIKHWRVLGESNNSPGLFSSENKMDTPANVLSCLSSKKEMYDELHPLHSPGVYIDGVGFYYLVRPERRSLVPVVCAICNGTVAPLPTGVVIKGICPICRGSHEFPSTPKAA